jgi:hypothetical protein
MVSATAGLFFGCWLILLACDNASRTMAALLYLCALVVLIAAMCLRGEIALAFGFVGLAALLVLHRRGAVSRPRLAEASFHVLATGAVLVVACGVFWVLQRPYVEGGGGALESLRKFIADFTSLGRVAQGVAVLLLSLGFGTALLCAGSLWWRRKEFSRHRWLIVVCLVLIVPSLAFWLTNPRPARHFLFPLLGIYIVLGALWTDKLQTFAKAALAALLLVAVNQAASEAVRPMIVRSYQWSFETGDRRRAVQQAPLGFFPLDQRTNFETEEVFRREAKALAASGPTKLLFVGDTPFYAISWLIHAHPGYRLTETELGRFKVYLLKDGDQEIWFIDKYHYWPADVLPEVLSLPEVASYKVYVQPATVSRYDKTSVPPERAWRLQ